MIDARRRKLIDALSKKLADEGKLIEAGWVALRMIAIPDDAPERQVSEMRKAYFAGAQHLFASMMSIMDPGEEPTKGDLRRMDLINAELMAFVAETKAELTRSKN